VKIIFTFSFPVTLNFDIEIASHDKSNQSIQLNMSYDYDSPVWSKCTAWDRMNA